MNLAKLKGLLSQNNYSQKYLCKLLNVSQTTIYKKMHGKVDFKSNELLMICKKFNVSMQYFFD